MSNAITILKTDVANLFTEITESVKAIDFSEADSSEIKRTIGLLSRSINRLLIKQGYMYLLNGEDALAEIQVLGSELIRASNELRNRADNSLADKLTHLENLELLIKLCEHWGSDEQSQAMPIDNELQQYL